MAVRPSTDVRPVDLAKVARTDTAEQPKDLVEKIASHTTWQLFNDKFDRQQVANYEAAGYRRSMRFDSGAELSSLDWKKGLRRATSQLTFNGQPVIRNFKVVDPDQLQQVIAQLKGEVPKGATLADKLSIAKYARHLEKVLEARRDNPNAAMQSSSDYWNRGGEGE